jgi:hypothetical protein
MTVALLNKTRKNPSLRVGFCNVVNRSIDHQYSVSNENKLLA